MGPATACDGRWLRITSTDRLSPAMHLLAVGALPSVTTPKERSIQ
jgi:hypothetical protein